MTPDERTAAAEILFSAIQAECERDEQKRGCWPGDGDQTPPHRMLEIGLDALLAAGYAIAPPGASVGTPDASRTLADAIRTEVATNVVALINWLREQGHAEAADAIAAADWSPIVSAPVTAEDVAWASAAAEDLKEAPPQSVVEWRPIEEAPLHQDLLLYREDAGVLLGQQTCLDGILSDKEIEGLEIPEEEIFRVGFYATSFDGGECLEGDLAPTHFAPLPAPRREAGPMGEVRTENAPCPMCWSTNLSSFVYIRGEETSRMLRCLECGCESTLDVWNRARGPISTPEPIVEAVGRALDECSAWIARPDPEVTERVALAAGIAASLHFDPRCLSARLAEAEDLLKEVTDLAIAVGPDRLEHTTAVKEVRAFLAKQGGGA